MKTSDHAGDTHDLKYATAREAMSVLRRQISIVRVELGAISPAIRADFTSLSMGIFAALELAEDLLDDAPDFENLAALQPDQDREPLIATGVLGRILSGSPRRATQTFLDVLPQYPLERPQPMTKLTRTPVLAKAASLIALMLIASLLTACASGGSTNAQSDSACVQMTEWKVQPGSQAVTVVLDHSKSTRDGSSIGSMLSSLITQAAGVYSTLSVLLADGQGAAPTWLIDDLALNNQKFDFDTLHYNQAVERAAECVGGMIGNPRPTAIGTDLGTAIQVASDRLAGSDGPRKLIVVSDGLSNAGPIDLTGMIAQTSVDKVIAMLDSQGYRPNLSGADVTFAGLGVTSGSVTDGPTVTWLRNYYLAICERAAAGGCAAPVADQGATADGTEPRADAPDDPDLALPAVQFEFSNSEVPFEPNSTAITPMADAALVKVSACLRDGSALTVIGHSASTGDAAGELTVSEGRAQNVANRILELAGNPVVTVNAFGVGSAEPKSATGHEPEDRRVDVSLTGVCR